MLYVNDLFLCGYNIPEPLSLEEEKVLFQKLAAGSKEAREKLIKHNIRIVLFEVTNKFKTCNCDMKDLVLAGNIGLVKAVDTYNLSYNVKFGTYAMRCIDNEILMVLRKIKKHQNVDSIDRLVFNNQDASEIELKDTLSDDIDIAGDYERAELCKIIRMLVENLPDCDKEIVMLHFGFYDRIYNQYEIADMLQMSQSRVSRKISRIVKTMSKQLESVSLSELQIQSQALSDNEKEENNCVTKDVCIKMLEVLKSPTYMSITSTLSAKEIVILSLKLGYLDGNTYSTETIAKFLGIEETEVIEKTKHALKLYKENLNDFLDTIAKLTDTMTLKRVLN